MGSGSSKNNSGNGNINYSLNKNDFYNIITNTSAGLIIFYYIILIISFIYIFNLKITTYKYTNSAGKVVEIIKTVNFFDNITVNSPFNILSKKTFEMNIGDKSYNYIGLSIYSYLLIICSFVAAFMILLNGLLRNYIYSIIGNIIQTNPNNNPYNNPACIKKIGENPNLKVFGNYFTIVSLSLFFLLPFLVGYLSRLCGFDNYDIKKSYWFNYAILFLVFSPFLIIFFLRTSISKKLSIFPDLYKYIDSKDNPYIDYIASSFNLKFSTFSIFLFILFTFSYVIFIYTNFQISNNKYKAMLYGLIFILLFIFIPIFLLFFCYLTIFSSSKSSTDLDNPPKNAEEAGQMEIDSIRNNKNCVSSLYQLLVKYNYPCFLK